MYNWINDPNSTVDPTQSSFAIDPNNHDVIKYTNLLATNTSGRVRVPGGVTDTGPATEEVALTWDNSLHGWYTPDFIAGNDDTHESLLVTALLKTSTEDEGPPGLLAKNVADVPQTLDTGIFQQESIQPHDLLPFINIGGLAAGASKPFEIDFTFHWGGADLGAMRTGQAEFTLVPDHSHP